MNWNIIIWLAGSFSIAEILNFTGGMDILANSVANFVPVGISPFVLFALVMLACMLITQIASNTACVLIFMPVFLPMADMIGISPYPIAMAVIFGSSFAFATPIASGQIGMALSVGHNFKDVVRFGWPLHVIMYIVAVIVIPLVFPF